LWIRRYLVTKLESDPKVSFLSNVMNVQLLTISLVAGGRGLLQAYASPVINRMLFHRIVCLRIKPMDGRNFCARRHRAAVGTEFVQSLNVGTFVGHHANAVVLESEKRPATRFPCSPPLAATKSSSLVGLLDILYLRAM
jgi:hypothetical protein